MPHLETKSHDLSIFGGVCGHLQSDHQQIKLYISNCLYFSSQPVRGYRTSNQSEVISQYIGQTQIGRTHYNCTVTSSSHSKYTQQHTPSSKLTDCINFIFAIQSIKDAIRVENSDTIPLSVFQKQQKTDKVHQFK